LGFVWLVVRRRKRLSPVDFTNWKKDSEFGDDDWRLLLAFGRREPFLSGDFFSKGDGGGAFSVENSPGRARGPSQGARYGKSITVVYRRGSGL
jgi:hypothetical protein